MARKRRSLLGRKAPRRGSEPLNLDQVVDSDARPTGLTEDYVPAPPEAWSGETSGTWIDESTSVPGAMPNPTSVPVSVDGAGGADSESSASTRTPTADDSWSMWDDESPSFSPASADAGEAPAEPAVDDGLGERAEVADFDFLDDLHRNFDFDSSPPTEEADSPLFEDHSHHAAVQAGVAQAADLAGFIANATPAPVVHRERAPRLGTELLQSPDAPAHNAADVDDLFDAIRATPAPIRRDPSHVPPSAISAPVPAREAPLEERLPPPPQRRGPGGTRVFIALGVGLVIALSLVAAAVVPWAEMGANLADPGSPDMRDDALFVSPGPDVVAGAPDRSVKGVEVRKSLRGSKDVFDLRDADAPVRPPPAPRKVSPADLVRPAPGLAPVGVADVISEGPDEDEEDLIGGSPAPQPAPAVATPRPTPRIKPAQVPAAADGTLEIRANRRVVIYVDNHAYGYTPQTITVPLGVHEIRVMLPGQPASEQTRTAQLDAQGQVRAISFVY